jgi:methyl-accepting chemotaxis protein
MKHFKNLKIAIKITISFIIVAIIAGIVGGVGIINIRKISVRDKALYNNMTLPIAYSADLAKSFQRIRVNTREMILESDVEKINERYDNVVRIIEEMNELSKKFENTIISNEMDEAFKSFMKTRENFRSNLDRLHGFCIENEDNKAFSLIKGDMRIAADAEKNAIDKLVQLKAEDARKYSMKNTKEAKTSIVIMISLVAIAILISIVLGLFIANIISKPIKQVADAAIKVADRDLTVDININSKDEVGVLANAFNKMVDNMNNVIGSIASASEQVASGSKQVSDSSMSLSQGATEQASTIEQLTASLQEISSQTSLNANSANDANELANKAQNNAINGNQQMKEMLGAMEEINNSSSNISKIIKVIEEIAFQTNILALNAAVEAARAGQHGKGFAVVAEEVRNLAARSANAAKETTAMIESSIKKVDDGTKIANETAVALNKIVEDIEKVASLVNDITVASNEQALGVTQINQGIMQVSEVVQTTSATSEETASASEELSEQADMLNNQVNNFKLKDKNTSSYIDYDDIDPEVFKMIEEIERKKKAEYMSDENESQPKIDLGEKDFGKYM